MIKEQSRIAITGASGSIGRRLVEKLLIKGHTVCALDNNEDGLFRLDQKFKSEFSGRIKLFLGDIRDKDRLYKAFKGVDIVFHCAALKHVFLSEYNPFEATKTNLIGVNNVIDASLKEDVKSVIFTSSDKAVNPSSTMGATKLLGERLFTAANHYIGNKRTRFASVRFGNVLNTNGSILQIFRQQILNNKPLTITSKYMTRFFITMDQAIKLCLQASNEIIGGEIFISNMGSCTIMSIAKAISGKNKFNFKIIGPKSGEKLYEELVTETEAERTVSNGEILTILPDTLDMMPDEIGKNFNIKYKNCVRLNQPVRSDIDLLSDSEVSKLLMSNELI